jgi:hypothetical protein
VRDLAQLLEESTPFPHGARHDWEAVLADAKRRRVRRLGPVAALAVAVSAAAMLTLFWPFGNGRPGGILDRALAAAGDGPVVHLVVREGWGGTLVDLATGARSPVYAERELWYDPARGLHEAARLGGQQIGDVLHHAGAVPSMAVREFTSLARNYRSSLESGDAKLVGPGTLDGMPVYWIRFETRHYPDVADGKLHELGDDIAISKDDYAPVGMRETLDGKDQPDGPSRVLDYETLPAGSGDFSTPPHVNTDTGTAYRFGPQGALTSGEAAQVLPAVWDGGRLGELPLAGITKLEWAERPAGVSTWMNETHGVRLVYSAGNPTIAAIPGPLVQAGDGPYVVIDEFPSSAPSAALRIGGYKPPADELFLQEERGTLVVGGVAISIVATSADLVVQAAQQLEPIPSG